MRTFLIILVFLIFCVVSFFIGYNLGINEQIERELFESFGAEIQNEIEEISSKDEAIRICQKRVRNNLNTFRNFIIYTINVLYIKVLKADKPEHIRLSQLKELIGKLNKDYKESKENNEPTNIEKLCSYFNKYMKVIQIGNYWINQRTKTINDELITIPLYYESDETGKHYLSFLFAD